jgi:Fe-S-cluster-containing dehydrogenase component
VKSYAVSIDQDHCWGCKACEVACKQENNPPYGVRFISVLEKGPSLEENNLETLFVVNICRHCDSPDCADACPEDAIRRREDGIVILDNSLCTGCRSCLDACPYDAIAFDEEKNMAVKCNLCYQRVDAGLIPACADNVCLAHCIHFIEVKKK